MAPLVAVMLTCRRVVAEQRPDGRQLGRVALRRARGVGADEVDLGGLDAGLVERPSGGPQRARAARRGQRDVAGVGGRARSRRPRPGCGAPRRSAWPSSSSTSTAAPSAMTKPSRPWSNGRLAPAGSSLRVDSARIAAKPPTSRLVDGRLGAAGEHHLGVAAQDRLGRLADGVAGRWRRR